MRKGLKFTKVMSFFNLIDASNVIQVLNTHQQYPNYVGYIIGDCINFNVFFCSLSFLHVRHESNSATHYLS